MGMKRKEKTATKGWSSGSGTRGAAGRRGRARAQRCCMVGAGPRECGGRRRRRDPDPDRSGPVAEVVVEVDKPLVRRAGGGGAAGTGGR